MDEAIHSYSRKAERLVERIVWKRGDVGVDRARLTEAIQEQARSISDFLIERSRRPERPSLVAKDQGKR